VKSRKVVEPTQCLDARWMAIRDGEISFGDLDASVLGWINHVAQADSWGCDEGCLRRMWCRRGSGQRMWAGAGGRVEFGKD
jgi:hypothetical protein